jgi:hypothetical protein
MSEQLVTIPVAVFENMIEVTYRSDAVKAGIMDLPTDETAKDYAQIVDLFCRIVQDWNLTETLNTRFKGRVVQTTVKVQVTRTRLLGEPPVPGFLLMHVLVAVVADWSITEGKKCTTCAKGGAKVAAEEGKNG